jgi:hypothetical protein
MFTAQCVFMANITNEQTGQTCAHDVFIVVEIIYIFTSHLSGHYDSAFAN